MTKKQEKGLQQQLVVFDETVNYLKEALEEHIAKVDEKTLKSSFLYVCARGKSITALISPNDPPERYAIECSVYDLIKFFEGHHILREDKICEIAAQWVFCYLQHANPYDFAADYGRFQYFANWILEESYNHAQEIANLNNPCICISSSRKNRFRMTIVEKDSIKESSHKKLYGKEILDDKNLVLFPSVPVCRIAAEWVFGILK